ncbi:MAG: carboxypeptidase regulatory-like domain-containing protein [Blastocatellia bacterium]
MKIHLLRIVLLIIPAALPVIVPAQTPVRANAAISGRVVIGDKGVAGVEVLLVANNSTGFVININGGTGSSQSPPMTAVTDADGRYRLTGIAPGSYRVTAYAPAYVIPDESSAPFNAGKSVTVAEGEAIDNINFTLKPGGVITGRIVDADNRPVVAERVSAFRLDESGKRINTQMPGLSQWETDDRGAYRLFGLEPGRYLIAAGSAADDGMVRFGGSGGYYRRTFHPDAVEEAQAKVIEVSGGATVEGVDIRLARATKGFTVTGRVIDGDTGQPVPGVMIFYGVNKNGFGTTGTGGSATNSLGEFRLEGLTPNGYQASAMNIQASELYSESVSFEVTGGDVAGVEIKMYRGASISGQAVVEGATDPAVIAGLSKIQLMARTLGSEQQAITLPGRNASINPDGSFRISGVRPGRVQINAALFRAPKGFSLLRIEHNGAEVKNLEVSASDNVSGVRVVFAYGTAKITGKVEIKNGALPPGVRLMVIPTREGAASGLAGVMPVEVDSRMQFTIEGLTPGNYKLRFGLMNFNRDQPFTLPPFSQPVTVTGGDQPVTLVLDLAKKEGDK